MRRRPAYEPGREPCVKPQAARGVKSKHEQNRPLCNLGVHTDQHNLAAQPVRPCMLVPRFQRISAVRGAAEMRLALAGGRVTA